MSARAVGRARDRGIPGAEGLDDERDALSHVPHLGRRLAPVQLRTAETDAVDDLDHTARPLVAEDADRHRARREPLQRRRGHRTGVIWRGLPGTKLKPRASAPSATARSASSSVVIPQIFTNTLATVPDVFGERRTGMIRRIGTVTVRRGPVRSPAAWPRHRYPSARDGASSPGSSRCPRSPPRSWACRAARRSSSGSSAHRPRHVAEPESHRARRLGLVPDPRDRRRVRPRAEPGAGPRDRARRPSHSSGSTRSCSAGPRRPSCSRTPSSIGRTPHWWDYPAWLHVPLALRVHAGDRALAVPASPRLVPPLRDPHPHGERVRLHHVLHRPGRAALAREPQR